MSASDLSKTACSSGASLTPDVYEAQRREHLTAIRLKNEGAALQYRDLFPIGFLAQNDKRLGVRIKHTDEDMRKEMINFPPTTKECFYIKSFTDWSFVRKPDMLLGRVSRRDLSHCELKGGNSWKELIKDTRYNKFMEQERSKVRDYSFMILYPSYSNHIILDFDDYSLIEELNQNAKYQDFFKAMESRKIYSFDKGKRIEGEDFVRPENRVFSLIIQVADAKKYEYKSLKGKGDFICAHGYFYLPTAANLFKYAPDDCKPITLEELSDYV